MSNVLRVQDLEVTKGSKKQGYLKISEKPAGIHQVPMTLINGQGDGPTLIVNGGEHGSEYNGPAAALRLCVELDAKKVSGNVIIVPLVNTLAFEGRWMHSNPVDYRDITSCYLPEIPKTGSGHPLITYQVANTFYRDVLSKGDYRLNLHGGDIEEDVLVSTMYSKTGTDAKRDALSLALCRNFGWQWIREGLPKPKSQGDKGLPMPISMGTEASGMGRCQSDIVEQVVKGVMNVMKFLNMLDGKPDIPPTAKVFNPYHIYSNHGGFFISNVRASDLVTKGDTLGSVRNLFGEIVEEIQAPTDGVIHMVTSPSVYEGDVLYEIGKDIREMK